MKNVLFIFLFLFLFVFSGIDSYAMDMNSSDNQSVGLFLDLRPEKDRSRSDALWKNFQKSIKQSYPKTNVRRVSATSKEELKDKLLDLGRNLKAENKGISRLLIDSDGSSGPDLSRIHIGSKDSVTFKGLPGIASDSSRTDNKKKNKSEEEAEQKQPPTELAETKESNTSQPHDTNIDSINSEGQSTFSGIRDLILPNAQVLTTASNLVSPNAPYAANQIEAISNGIGLKDGKVYANFSTGIPKEFRSWRLNLMPSLLYGLGASIVLADLWAKYSGVPLPLGVENYNILIPASLVGFPFGYFANDQWKYESEKNLNQGLQFKITSGKATNKSFTTFDSCQDEMLGNTEPLQSNLLSKLSSLRGLR